MNKVETQNDSPYVKDKNFENNLSQGWNVADIHQNLNSAEPKLNCKTKIYASVWDNLEHKL